MTDIQKYFNNSFIQPKIKQLGNKHPKQFVFFANSHIYYNNSVHNHLNFVIYSWLGKKIKYIKDEDKKNLEYFINSAFYNRQPITVFGDITDRLKKEFWNRVSPIEVAMFQCTYLYHSTIRNSQIQEHIEYYTKAFNTCRDNNVVPTVMMPTEKLVDGKWVEKDYYYLRNLFTDIGNKGDALVIPVGVAYHNFRKKYPDTPLLNDWDNNHPNQLGTLLTTYTIFSAYYNVDPTGIDYRYNWDISDEQLNAIQTEAYNACTEYYT